MTLIMPCGDPLKRYSLSFNKEVVCQRRLKRTLYGSMRTILFNLTNTWAGQLSFTRKVLIIIGLLISTNVLLLALFFALEKDSLEAERLVMHSKEVLLTSEKLFKNSVETQLQFLTYAFVKSVESPELEERLTTAVTETNKERLLLASLVVDNAPQRILLQQINEMIDQYQETIKNSATALRDGLLTEPDKQANIQSLRARLRNIRLVMTEFALHEEALSNARKVALSRTQRTNAQFVLLSCGLLIGLSLILALLFHWSVNSRLQQLISKVESYSVGNPLPLTLSGHDEISQLERAFYELSKNLHERASENEAFIYSVSHDMRSPLVNLQGFAEEIKLSIERIEPLANASLANSPQKAQLDSLTIEDIKKASAYVGIAVDRLSTIIDGLLRLSRAGRVEYNLSHCDCNAIVQRIIKSFQATIEEKNMVVDVGELPMVYADPTALDKIFANIIDNAIKYTNPARPGIIRIYHMRDHSTPNETIAIEDNGLGFPEVYMKKVFLPFQRYHQEIASGEGIGLALVSRMLQKLSGSIWVSSTPDKGSCFYITLPGRAPGDVS